MAKIINLTPHDVNIFNNDDYPLVNLGYADKCARVGIEYIPDGGIVVDDCDPIPVYRNVYTPTCERLGLPDPEFGTFYVVSKMAYDVLRTELGRIPLDVFYPGSAVRDENGKVIGCVGLSHD